MYFFVPLIKINFHSDGKKLNVLEWEINTYVTIDWMTSFWKTQMYSRCMQELWLLARTAVKWINGFIIDVFFGTHVLLHMSLHYLTDSGSWCLFLAYSPTLPHMKYKMFGLLQTHSIRHGPLRGSAAPFIHILLHNRLHYRTQRLAFVQLQSLHISHHTRYVKLLMC